MAVVLSISSGKGGVGKTNTAANLGLSLALRNVKVCIFDADTGLANINILLDIHPQYNIEHVLSGEKNIHEIIVQTAEGLHIVPGASGISACVDLDETKRQLLIKALSELETKFDYIIIDTAAGIDSNVLDFVASSQYRIVVITPEPTSLTDAFALLKLLAMRGGKKNIYTIVNRVDGYKTSQIVFKRLQLAVEKYLKINIQFLGYLANDRTVVDAVKKQVPVVVSHPEASVSCCFFALADIIKRQFNNEREQPYFSHFWGKLAASRFQQQRQREKTAIRKLSRAQQSAIASQLRSEDVYQWVKHSGSSEKELSQLINSILQEFEKKFDHPYKSDEQMMRDLLEQCGEDEARDLFKILRQQFEEKYNVELDDPVDQVANNLQNENVGKQQFDDLMKQFCLIYQFRFGVRYLGESQRLLDDIELLLERYRP